MIPLGPVFAKEALGGDSATFGALMTALGFGAAAGVVVLLIFQKRLPRETVFEFSVMGTGIFLILAASLSALGPAALAVGIVGACAGTSYVTGFTVLQETVKDEIRGRTFATLYTVIRMCLLISLVISPLVGRLLGLGHDGGHRRQPGRHTRGCRVRVPGRAHRAVGWRVDHTLRRMVRRGGP